MVSSFSLQISSPARTKSPWRTGIRSTRPAVSAPTRLRVTGSTVPTSVVLAGRGRTSTLATATLAGPPNWAQAGAANPSNTAQLR